MAIALRLTGYQRQVADRLLVLTGAATPDHLATAAVTRERGRAPEPRWRRPRPAGRPPAAAPADVVLDAVLPAACGIALRLSRGQRLRIEQLGDGQGVDLRAHARDGRQFSAARTRAIDGIHPTVGAALWSTPPEAPLLTILADSAPDHDLCFPPCSEREYFVHAGIAGHLGCVELHADALARRQDDSGASWPAGEDVLNLWLPSDVSADGRLCSWPASCRTGDGVELRAQVDLEVTLTTCPDDLFGTSQYEPKPVRVLVSGGPAGPVDTGAWPAGPPASAVAAHPLEVALADGDLEFVDQLAAGGWVGTDRATVLRALIFRLHEAVVGHTG